MLGFANSKFQKNFWRVDSTRLGFDYANQRSGIVMNDPSESQNQSTNRKSLVTMVVVCTIQPRFRLSCSLSGFEIW